VLVAIAVFTVAVGVGFLVRAGVEALTRRLVSDYDSTTVVGERSGVLASLTMGLVGAGYLYEYTDNLAVPILVHGLFNATNYALNYAGV
jgi:membrane protease YdiL (CAAX protease family)